LIFGLIVGCGALLTIGLIVLVVTIAVAVQGSMERNRKARQVEAKDFLWAIYSAQMKYYGEYGNYIDNFADIKFDYMPARHYSYFPPADAIYGDEDYKSPEEARPYVTTDSFMAVAVGDLDSDQTLDVWVIDDNKSLQNVVDDLAD